MILIFCGRSQLPVPSYMITKSLKMMRGFKDTSNAGPCLLNIEFIFPASLGNVNRDEELTPKDCFLFYKAHLILQNCAPFIYIPV